MRALALIPAALLMATQAHATLQFAANVNGTPFFCADNTACDTNPAAGVLQIADQVIGGVTVNGSIATSLAGNGFNLLDVSSLSIVNGTNAAVPIEVTVGDNNYTPPVNQLETTGSGTWVTAVGSNVTLKWFDDPANTQGANTAGDTPGNQVDTFSNTATIPAQSFHHDFVAPVSDLLPFSMTLDASGLLTAGGSLLNRGQAEIKTSTIEPGTLALLGGSLIIFGLIRRR